MARKSIPQSRRKIKTHIWRIVINVDIGHRNIIEVEKLVCDALLNEGMLPVLFADRSRKVIKKERV